MLCEHDFDEEYSVYSKRCRKCGFLSAKIYGVASVDELIMKDHREREEDE